MIHRHMLDCLADVGGKLVYKCGHDNPRETLGRVKGLSKAAALLVARQRRVRRSPMRGSREKYEGLKQAQYRRAPKGAGPFIAEEISTGKYPREQAIAIGIARARREGHHSPYSFVVHYEDGSTEKGAIFNTLDEAHSAMAAARAGATKAIHGIEITDEGRGGKKVGRTGASSAPKKSKKWLGVPWSRMILPERNLIMRDAWVKVPNPPALGEQSHEAKELTLYADNDAGIHAREKFFDINLLRKIRDGKFDFEKSVKLWTYLMDEAAKKYDKEFSSPAHGRSPRTDRRQAARAFAREFVVEGKLGNRSHRYPEM